MAERRKTFFATGHELDRHRVEPDGRWECVSNRFVYPKACFEKAGEFVRFHFGPYGGRDATLVRLVHGYYQPPSMPCPFSHAWVDLGTGVVFDGVLQGFYDAGGYAEVYRTEAVIRYTVGEMTELMRAHRHWGVWDPAIRGIKPPPPSALPEANAFVVVDGKPRPGHATPALGRDDVAWVSLKEDVGPVGPAYYLAGDAVYGRRVGEHGGLPLYEPVAPGEMRAEGAGERPRRAAKTAKPARRRGT